MNQVNSITPPMIAMNNSVLSLYNNKKKGGRLTDRQITDQKNLISCTYILYDIRKPTMLLLY